MRRTIALSAAAAAFAIALLVGPLGAAAAGPYVYGCEPIQFHYFGAAGGGVGHETIQLTIYNGAASAATLTHKILAGNGTILNNTANVTPAIALTTTLAATTSEEFAATVPVANVLPTQNDIPAAIRVVSNVPVAVGAVVTASSVVHVIECSDLRP
jgi:hypothetical protein